MHIGRPIKNIQPKVKTQNLHRGLLGFNFSPQRFVLWRLKEWCSVRSPTPFYKCTVPDVYTCLSFEMQNGG